MVFDIINIISSAASKVISLFEQYWIVLLAGVFIISMFVAYMIFIRGAGL